MMMRDAQTFFFPPLLFLCLLWTALPYLDFQLTLQILHTRTYIMVFLIGALYFCDSGECVLIVKRFFWLINSD